jgi:5-methylcytosine-specific restriction endonuclease McrA
MVYSAERREQIFGRTDGRCHICWKRLVFSTYGQSGGWEIEHSIPASLGGSSRLSNLYPSHILCNRQKGSRTTRTARSWHGRSKAPLSRKRKEEIRESNQWGLGTVGALAGSALAGPVGIFVGAVLGALAGSEINPE